MRSSASPRASVFSADACAVAVIAALALLAFITFDDYGLGWDDFTHSQYGDLLLAYFTSGFTDHRVFRFVNLYYYGGGFDVIAALASKILPVDIFSIRRFMGALVGLVGFVIVWRTGRRIAGPVGGLAALCLLAICPLYYGHIFMNAKDAPFAVAMASLLYILVRALDEYPNPAPRTVAWFGVLLGFTVGTRVLGLISVAYCGLAAAFLLAVEWRALGLKVTLLRFARFALLLSIGLPLGYLVLGLIWPWGVVTPDNPLVALKYYSHFWEVPWREMFEGRLIWVPDMPRTYVPTLFSVQMPELFLGLAVGGIGGAIVAAFFGSAPASKRARLVLIVAAAVFPVMLTVVTRPVMYNGIRHFVFVTPPLALLGGFAMAWLWEKARTVAPRLRVPVAGLFVLGVAVPAVDFAEIHPYEYTYYNHIVGGVRGAEDKFMLDYWGLAFKQATDQLDEYVESHRRALPQGRKLRVAVCGPHRAAAAELGPRYETTYDSRNADFALMLGEFYCADVKAPVLVEIEREGVIYARVYDVRGRPFPSVFAAGQ